MICILKSLKRNMSKGNVAKASLAKKLQLAKGSRVQKLQAEEAEMPDIEDVVMGEAVEKSRFFSPLQTRQQRRNNAKDQQKMELPEKQSLEPAVQKSTLEIPTNQLKVKTQTKAEEQTQVKLITDSVADTKTMAHKNEAEAPQWQPTNWQQVLENVRKMRASMAAPVDSMGCHKCTDDEADEKTQRFQKLVALMLSSQTKDETTFGAMQRLKTNMLIPANIVAMDTSKLEDLLRPVSFYKNKAKYLQQASRILIEKYDGDIPNNIKELIALPGVGPKMAHICMATAWNETTGIGVDVHVHRISNRLRWVPKETKEPEQTRVALERWLPRNLWREVNALLVGFGQTICTPVRPHCGDCLNRDICPSADNTAKKKADLAVEQQDDGDLSPMKKAKFQKKKINL